MASVIARGILISPGFSRPSVSWCMFRLQGRSKVVLPQRTDAYMQHAWVDTQICTHMSGYSQRPCSLAFFSHPWSFFKAPQSREVMLACMHVYMHTFFFLQSSYFFFSRLLWGALLYLRNFSSFRSISKYIYIKGFDERLHPQIKMAILDSNPDLFYAQQGHWSFCVA